MPLVTPIAIFRSLLPAQQAGKPENRREKGEPRLPLLQSSYGINPAQNRA